MSRGQRTDTGRRQRPLLGGGQLKLKAPDRKGYQRRWVNDDPGRLDEFQAAEYSFVKDEIQAEGRAENKRARVGTHPDGSPKYAYLMEKPEDWYREDMARKMADNDQREAQIFSGEPEHDAKTGATDRTRFYTKHAEITRG